MARSGHMNIAAWLKGLGLDQYASAFDDNAIDAEVLPRLTADDLKEIGVGALGHRKRILEAIAALEGHPETVSVKADAAPASSTSRSLEQHGECGRPPRGRTATIDRHVCGSCRVDRSRDAA